MTSKAFPPSSELLAQGRKQTALPVDEFFCDEPPTDFDLPTGNIVPFEPEAVQAPVQAQESEYQIDLSSENVTSLMQKYNNRQLRPNERANTFGQLIDTQAEGLKKIMPPHMTIQRLREIMVLQLKEIPKLLDCDMASLMMAVYQAGALGLEPYKTMGELYIIPYGKEAQVIIGYKGLKKLAMNTGELASIESRCVYLNEYEQGRFSVEYGTNTAIHHQPIVFGDKGELIGVYAVAHFKDVSLSPVVEFMSVDDVTRIRDGRKNGAGNVWQAHFDEMARKTVLRRIIKSLSLSVTPKELSKALSMDNEDYIDVKPTANLYGDA